MSAGLETTDASPSGEAPSPAPDSSGTGLVLLGVANMDWVTDHGATTVGWYWVVIEENEPPVMAKFIPNLGGFCTTDTLFQGTPIAWLGPLRPPRFDPKGHRP